MGFLKGKLVVFGVLAALFGATVHAEEVVTPMNETDPLVAFENGLTILKTQIEQAEGLDDAQRARVLRDLIDQTEGMRDRVAEINRIAAILGENVFVAGMMITYMAEYNFQTPWSLVQTAPGGEYGLAIYLKKNEEFFTESLRFAGVGIGNFGIEVSAGRNAIVRRTGAEAGFRLKVLVARNQGPDTQGVMLTDFEGPYTGLGGEVSLFGRDLGLQVFTKPETCESVSPTSCGVYVFAVQGSKGDVQGPAFVGKEIFVDFTFDNNGEGYHF